MNYTEADHVWFIERIEAYLGGDLAGDELARFEAHAAACLPCEAKLGDGSRSDAALRELFAAHRPAAGLEDRAIAGVRTSLDRHRPRLLLNPKVRRAASVAAAALVLAAMGYVGKLALDGGSLSRFNPGRLLAKSPKEFVAQLRGDRPRQPTASVPLRPPPASKIRNDELTAEKAAVNYELDQAVNAATDAIVSRDAAAARTQIARAKVARSSRPADFTAEELALFDSRIAEAQSRLEQTQADTNTGEQKATADRIAREEADRRGRESREKRETLTTLINTAQQSLRDAKYKEALGTVDQILIVDPNNDYARGVRPLVQDKATLAQAHAYHREFDDNMERSLNQAEEKRIPYEDIMRYPANWPDISEVRDRTVAQERTVFSAKADPALQTPTLLGRVSGGDQQLAGGRRTVSVPVGGTMLLGGQVLDGTVVTKAGAGSLSFKTSNLNAGKSGGKEQADSNALSTDGDVVDRYMVRKDAGDKQVALLTDKTKGGTTLDLNGGALEVKSPAPDMMFGSDGRVVHGTGTTVLNGENSYAGATIVNGGTLNYSFTPPVTGKPAAVANGTVALGTNASSSNYAYFDSVKAPQPAEAQHAKLAEVASADRGRTPRSDTLRGFRGEVTLGDGDGKGAKDGAKADGVADTAGRTVALGKQEDAVRLKRQGEPDKLGLPAIQSDHALKDKPASGKPAESTVDEKLRTVVVKAGDTDGPAAQQPAAPEPGVVANTGLNPTVNLAWNFKTESLARQGKTREYNVQDLITDVPDFITPPEAKSTDPKRPVTPLKVDDVREAIKNAQQLEKPAQFALANPVTPTTGPATQAASTGVPAVAPQAGTPATQQAPPAPVQRKIIRNGEMIFEVDSFDSSYMQIGKIVAEEGGYIGTTDSEKLPNGKVKGTITLRVPPDRLDVLILKLRGLGDLKNQRIAAADVTKQFIDSESQLRADRAMEERLLDLIKNGKGQVKDLVAAEKELGNYREKIEQLEGELRYLQSMVSLSTLNITLFERDIKTPTAAFEAETVDAAIETEEVEKGRAEAIKAVEEAKGRVIESQMKRFEAGQLQATIVAEVAPENAGPVIDRLKQLGHVARFDVERKQTTQGGQGAPVGLKLERRATVLKVSIYNLANIAPRETVNVSLAAEDVEKAYKAILAAAEMEEVVNGVTVKVGRVVSSSLNSQRADQTTGNISIEVRADKAAAVEAAIRSAGGTGGEVMHLTVTENPDANNVTRAKRGYVVTLASLSSVAPRETAVLSVAAKDVPSLYQTLMAQLQDGKDGKGRGKVYASRLEEQDRQNVEAFVDFEIPRGESANIEALLNSGTTSDVFRRNVTRSPDVTNTLDSKLRMQVSILNVGRLRPREESMFTVEVGDPEAALLAVQGIATTAGGRTYEPHLNKDESGKIEGQVTFDVPLSAASATADKLRALGTVRQSRSLTNESVPAGTLAKARFDVTVVNAKQLVAANHGVGARIREGVGTSLDALLLLLEWVIVVAPFVLVLWLLWKLFRRGKKTPATTAKPAVG